MRREAVPQGVRADLAGDAAAQRIVIDEARDRTDGQTAAAPVEKDYVGVQRGAAAEVWHARPVGSERCQRRLTDRHDALLAALAAHPYDRERRVDVVPIQSHQLADAQAAGVGDL